MSDSETSDDSVLIVESPEAVVHTTWRHRRQMISNDSSDKSDDSDLRPQLRGARAAIESDSSNQDDDDSDGFESQEGAVKDISDTDGIVKFPAMNSPTSVENELAASEESDEDDSNDDDDTDDESIVLASASPSPKKHHIFSRRPAPSVSLAASMATKRQPSSPEPLKPKTTSSLQSPKDEITIEDSPLKHKFSPAEVTELTNQLSSQRKVVDSNMRLLQRAKGLPDNGKRLIEYIQVQKKRLSDLELKVKNAKENVDPSVQPELSEAEKLDKKKMELRKVSQKYAMLNDVDEKLELLKVREKLTKEVVALSAQVQFQVSKGPKKIEVPPVQSNAKWQEYRAGPMFNSEAGVQQEQLFAHGPVSNPLYGGRMNDARRNEVLSSIRRRIELIQKSKESRPNEADCETDPVSLRDGITLFPHQRQGLAWMMWRESQHPGGGILADDMGLGKTLSMIALITKSKELFQKDDSKGSGDFNWISKSKETKSKGTLIICPASLIGQWENEVKNRLKRGTLNVLVYHGANREQSATSLARYDMVITTYGTLSSEVKKAMHKDEIGGKGKLDDLKAIDLDTQDAKNVHFLSIAWERVILDEAHQIRNPRSQTAQAVCRLKAAKRWAVTGTPIQNKELDLYSLIRFLRIDPFDEYKVWKLWVENKTSMGQTRMNTLVENLLLRRTKNQISTVTGKAIVDLPDKQVVNHEINLTEEESKVYDKVFSFSQQAMINYMKTHDENFVPPPDLNKNDKYAYRPPNTGGPTGEVKASHLLVLLLRLRQICCHPGLIRTMIDQESKVLDGLVDNDDDLDDDLVAQMSGMTLTKGSKKTPDPENELTDKVLSPDNPTFDERTPSSKISTLVKELSVLKKKYDGTGEMEKIVVVSQWTSMLNIVKNHIKTVGMKFAEIHGSVPVKSRGSIVTDFNREGKGAQVMLLSLGAGGVGLNLVGANHLFLLDMHWNPQQESQACDRIYRVGQKKNVTIHRFLCQGTVEARISKLQENKLALADGILTGAKRSNANKLSLKDLQSLFNL